MEALQSGVSVSVSADLSSIHGLYDLSVFSHGLLASHHNLLLHPHLTTGNTQADRSSYTHTYAHMHTHTVHKKYLLF